MKTIPVERFVRYLRANIEHNDRYAFFLGAGCSMPDIPGAGGLVRQWLPRLCRQETGTPTLDPDWLARRFPDYDPDGPALSYAKVMGELFLTAADRQREIERIVSNRDPGFAYAVLAKLLSHERHGAKCNLVLTTNFDDMVADALYVYGRRKPLVVVHESLAGFVEGGRDRPVVVKLHGDALLSPKNLGAETKELDAGVRTALEKQLTQRGIIFVGYGGNDESIASFFESYLAGKETRGLFWVNEAIPEGRFGDWLCARPDAIWVPHLRFDELMVLVRDAFELAHPNADRFKQLMTQYHETFDVLTKEVDSRSDEVDTKPTSDSLRSAVEQARKDFDSWWAVELEARRFKSDDPARADQVYREGIERFPNSPELQGNYALFLKRQGRLEEAEHHYKRALSADPEHANNLGNYAVFLDERGRLKEAEHHYKLALAADPEHANNLGSYAVFLDERGRLNEAEQHYKLALAADPEHAGNLGNYATFLGEQGHPVRAVNFFERALSKNPEHSDNLGNYAGFLLAQGRTDVGIPLAQRALSNAVKPKDDELLVEVHFYLFANDAASMDSLSALKELISQGVRTPNWDFSSNLERAREEGHTYIALLEKLAAVLSDGAEASDLEEFAVWREA